VNRLLHDIRNELAVAIASVQAFIDGKLEPTKENFDEVLESLENVNRLLADLARAQR
jgi:hypothetical protein